MKTEIAKIILDLAVYYNATISEKRISLFVEDLKNLELEFLKRASEIYRLNPENKFFPLPSALLAIYKKIKKPESLLQKELREEREAKEVLKNV